MSTSFPLRGYDMTYPAFCNLRQQKFRLALSIGGVALAMMLIVLLNGFLKENDITVAGGGQGRHAGRRPAG